MTRVGDVTVDQVSGATGRAGPRSLRRILSSKDSRAAIAAAVTDVAAGEPDSNAAVRLLLRKAFIADPHLADKAAAMVPATVVVPAASASGGARS